jgi:hypothetical protein
MAVSFAAGARQIERQQSFQDFLVGQIRGPAPKGLRPLNLAL